MNQEQLLAMLKIDLQLMTSVFDEYLTLLLRAAELMMTREGIKLTSSAEDDQLRIMYAAYLYRKRAGEGGKIPAMSPMLRWALNNRLFSQKAGEIQLLSQKAGGGSAS